MSILKQDETRTYVSIHIDAQTEFDVTTPNHDPGGRGPFGCIEIGDVSLYLGNVESVRGLIAALEKIEAHLGDCAAAEVA